MLAHEPGAPFNYRLRMSMTSMPRVEPMPGADVAGHVHRLTLAGDGSMDELLATVCELHETRLERSGLLWQFYVIDGLADGRVALYGKVHHGIIDGRGFVKAVTHWLSTDPRIARCAPCGKARRRRAPVDAPTAITRMHRPVSARRCSDCCASRPPSAARRRRCIACWRRRAGAASVSAARRWTCLSSSVPDVLGGVASAKRNYAFTTLPLAELKALGKAEDATVNDVLLAVLDGALDRYLAAQPKRPAKPLVVDMPVALADAGGGNQIAVLQLALGRAARAGASVWPRSARRPAASRRR